MKAVLDHFRVLSQIPHCSFETEQMRDFLLAFAKQCGAKVEVDELGNIYACKGEPKLCLQSHYDMVCMGQAPRLELFEEEGYLKAKDSSLGADNGMGCAIMMEALQHFSHLECLWTNDEEVGLVGANGLKHRLKSKKLLNLDHECDFEVTIGCAGGVDIFARMDYELEEKEAELYEVEVFGFKGGHSGVDILHNSSNAIKTLAAFLAQNDAELLEFCGGERINSIPKYARAKVIFPHSPKESPQVRWKLIGRERVKVLKDSSKFLASINAFAHGLRSFNPILQIAQTSINLALARLEEGQIKIDLFARSNDEKELRQIGFETEAFFTSFGYEVSFAKFYLPWEPKENAFSQEVLKVMKAHNPKARYYAIHAGLECGVIGAKQKELECCSIGPNIYNPHSTDERCEIASVERIAKVVFEVVERNQA